MRTKLVIANWKMNGSCQFIEDMAASLATENNFGGTDTLVICPPTPYLQSLNRALKSSQIQIGAQNLSEFASGAYTGEVSAAMILDAGAKWVIVGHSERRAYYGESNDGVASKVKRAIDCGLNAVVCVGETLEQRQAGITKKVIAEQLDPVLQLADLASCADRLVIAYEPVWAIGTGETASPEQAQEIHAYIRLQLGQELNGVAIVYGGSVKPDNAAQLFAQQDIDGGLVGGAALVAEDFLAICRAFPK